MESEILESMSIEDQASDSDEYEKKRKVKDIEKQKEEEPEMDLRNPPPGFKFVMSYENIMQMARINHLKEEKY